MTPPPGRLDFTFNFAADGTEAKPRRASGVGHLVFIAAYSGAAKSSTSSPALATWPLEVGEAFRIVPSAIAIEPLTPHGEPFLLPVVDTESLHPDALLETVPSLLEVWELLRDCDHDPSAAERLAAMLAVTSGERRTNPTPEIDRESVGTAPAAASTSREGAGDLLGRLLGQRPEHAGSADAPQAQGVSVASAQEIVQQFAKRLLGERAPAKHGGGSKVSSGLRARGEAELGRRLRALLRQDGFRRIAGSWLGTEMVVRSCPDDSRARFSAVDAAWSELVAKPAQFEVLLDSGASVVMIDHCFGAERDELRGLVELARACHDHRVFFVAGAAPSLAGLEEHFLQNPAGAKHDTEGWQRDWDDEQRESWEQLASLREQGAQFSLALPRCLVRHAYGKQGYPLEKFEFEELEDHPASSHFAWANGAYLVARALMEQWCGGAAQMDGSYEISGLPVVSVPDVNGSRAQPPIELSLPRSAVDQLLDQGFSVIEAWSNSDRARVYV